MNAQSRSTRMFVEQASVPREGAFVEAESLAEFRLKLEADEMKPDERSLVVRQAILLLEQNYAHLPLKRSMHSIDPVQRLKLLLQSVEGPEELRPTEEDFHRELLEAFTSLRDLHTLYQLPRPFASRIAYLPFMVEACAVEGRTTYVVSHVTPSFSHKHFRAGVEVLSWNGAPVERAAWTNAARHAGSNRSARFARGLQALTARALAFTPPPDEHWVIVEYRTLDGRERRLRFDWHVVTARAVGAADLLEAVAEERRAACTDLGVDLEQERILAVRCALFKPYLLEGEAWKKPGMAKSPEREKDEIESRLPKTFEAKRVRGKGGPFGYLRIRTFQGPADDFVDEFARLLRAMPPNGLLIDVRGNAGGNITSGERILQTLTPREIEPEPAQFLNTPLNLEICQTHSNGDTFIDLSRWRLSMEQALQTGSTYSAGHPITDPKACNELGQKYFGPVVLIVDALCYSTTDIFAAGFQDHEIGKVLGVEGQTGAGGANVWSHSLLRDHILVNGGHYQPLPRGADMRVAIRRTLRVGDRAGTPVEDLGVVPDEAYEMTRADVLESNRDLIARGCELLREENRPVRQLRVALESEGDGSVAASIEWEGMTRLDLYLDGRPLCPNDVPREANRREVSLPRDLARPGARLEVLGYDGGQRVARVRESL